MRMIDFVKNTAAVDEYPTWRVSDYSKVLEQKQVTVIAFCSILKDGNGNTVGARITYFPVAYIGNLLATNVLVPFSSDKVALNKSVLFQPSGYFNDGNICTFTVGANYVSCWGSERAFFVDALMILQTRGMMNPIDFDSAKYTTILNSKAIYENSKNSRKSDYPNS